MSNSGIDVSLLTHPRDVLYYAGTARPSTLLITSDQVGLFVRRGMDQACKEATVERVEQGGSISSLAKELAAGGFTTGTLGIEMDVMPVSLFLKVKEAFAGWDMIDVSPLVMRQRMVKDELEVQYTERASVIADAGHRALPETLRPGMTELELVAEVEAALRRAGHEGYQSLRRPGARGGGMLLASGENLTVRGGHGLVITGAGLSPGSPYGASTRQIHPGDLLVLDIGSTFMGYSGDESRTYVLGPASDKQLALYNATLATQEAVLAEMRPGTPVAQVYNAAQAVVAQGAPPHFGPGELTLPGFVGHGIGLELDEPPVLWEKEETLLAVGVVLAVEIEVSAPSAGMMTKIEDTVVIEANGPRILTAANRDLVEVPIDAH
jgi:Xaa-Pro aminopeptidase